MESPISIFVWLLITFLHLTSTSARRSTYIVHMDLSVMPKAFSGHHSWYAATLAASTDPVAIIGDTSNLIYVYDNVIHGFSATLTPYQLNALKKSHGYVSSYRDVPVRVDTTHTPEFLQLDPRSGIWPAADFGKDVIIGVVDSGVWPESKSFIADGMAEVPIRWKGECEHGVAFNSTSCNRKLIGARSFSKGLLAHVPNLTLSINSPRDTDGHGTHTSSTAAGNYVEGASYFGYAMGTARGMAPKAHVAMYKALWDVGAYTSDIVAAIDMAISDGVDVISLSLGLDGVPLHKDPIAIASFAAMEKGILVVSSGGNNGPFLGTLHNGTPWLVTVGASTVDREFVGIVTLGNGSSVAAASLYPGSPNFLREVPLIFVKACDNKKLLENVAYKIVVCEGKGYLGKQIDYVTSAKVAGALFILNRTVDTEFDLQFTFPAAIVSPKEAQTILEYIESSSNPIASLKFQQTLLGTGVAPSVADYSSRGPSLSCPRVLKPDIVAPGTLVLASWASNISVADAGSHQLFSDFNLISGTSMSCPHVSGVGALLKGVHPDWSPAAIRSAMMTTAYAFDDTLSPIKDMGDEFKPATPFALGAGHIDPNKALDPGLVYDAGAQEYVRLLCAMNYTTEQISTITRSSHFNCSSNSSFDLNYPSFIAFFGANDSSSVREFQRTVTNVGDEVSMYSAKVTSVDGFSVNVLPDTLVFREKYEKLSFALTIEGPTNMKEVMVHGSLSWVDHDGTHVVRSPIVATSLPSKPSF